MDTNTKARSSTARHNRQVGRDHLNLAEFPISVLQRSQPLNDRGQKVDTIVYESHRYDPLVHRSVPQTVTLTTSSRYGLPTPADETVVLGLLYLGKQFDNFQTDRVYFTPRQLFGVLNWSPNSRSYERLRQVLRRLKSLTIIYQNAWYDPDGRKYEKEFATGLISTYQITRQVAGPKDSREPRSWVRWDPEFFDSLQGGTLKTLNLPLVLSLSDTSRRLYRFLDKHFYYQSEHEFDLRDLACGHVGLSASYDTGQLKSKLRSAITELEAINFIENEPIKTRYRKVKPGQWRVHFRRAANIAGHNETIDSASLRLELTARGVTRAVAAQLVSDYPRARIQQKVELLDFLTKHPDRQAPKRSGGWLVKAIKDDFQPPPDFKTNAQRQEEAREKQRQRAAEQERVQREEAKLAQEQADRDALFSQWRPIWDALDQAQQQHIWEVVWGDNAFFTFKRHRDSYTALESCLRELRRRRTASEQTDE